MTMICPAANKAALKERLDRGCTVIEPMPGADRYHHSHDLPIGFKQPVVLDPATRRRFATIEKLPNGTWRVK